MRAAFAGRDGVAVGIDEAVAAEPGYRPFERTVAALFLALAGEDVVFDVVDGDLDVGQRRLDGVGALIARFLDMGGIVLGRVVQDIGVVAEMADKRVGALAAVDQVVTGIALQRVARRPAKLTRD